MEIIKNHFLLKFTAKPLETPINRYFFTAKITKKYSGATFNRHLGYHFKKLKIAFAPENQPPKSSSF